MMDPRVYKRRRSSRRSSSSSNSKPAEQQKPAEPAEPAAQPLRNVDYGFLRDVPESLEKQWSNTVYTDKRSVM